MDNQNLENLRKIAKVFQPENIITSTEIDQVLKGIMEILASYKKGTESINEDTKQVVNTLLEQVIKYNNETISDFKTEADKAHKERLTELQTLLSDIKSMVTDIEIMASELEDGKDADEERVIGEVISRIKIDPTVVTVSAEEIRNKLASLEGEDRLDKSSIKGLERILMQKDLDYAIATLQQQTSFLINKGGLKTVTHDSTLTGEGTPESPLSVVGGSGTGTVTQVDTAGLISGGPITTTGTITTSMATGKLVGRSTAGTGIMEEITVGSGLSLSGGTLTATGGGTGTVTDFIFTDGNGFNGTVTDSTTTPTLSLTTTVTNTQLMYSNSGAIAGISGATTNGTAVTYTTGNLIGADVKASGSGGLQTLSNNGTVTALFGAGGGANNTFYGDIKADYATASTIAIFDGSKNLISASTATYPSLTELSYVKGVTSAIQTQLDAKGSGTVTSVSSTNGALTVTNGTTTPSLTINSAPILTTARTIGIITGDATSSGSSFDGSANNTNALTLATVNSNVGSFTYASITVNAKGLVTAASNGTTPEVPLTFSTGLTRTVNTVTVNTSQNISTLSNLTSNGLVTTSGGTGALSVTVPGTGVLTALGINVGSAGAFVTFNGALGTPSSGTVTNLTGTASININGTVGATTPTTATFTTATVNTGLVPDANDGAYLGTSSAAFSDLFLAEGGVINWDNGDATLTQSGNTLTLAGADLTVDTLNVNTGVQLAENASIKLDPAGSADGKYTGTTITATAGYTQAFGDLVYLDPTDSRWEAADANSASGADGDARGILGMVVVAGTDGNACTILLNGVIRADAKFPTFTVNNPIYVSETAGSVTQTVPTTSGVVERLVGYALTADEMYFCPDNTWIIRV